MARRNNSFFNKIKKNVSGKTNEAFNDLKDQIKETSSEALKGAKNQLKEASTSLIDNIQDSLENAKDRISKTKDTFEEAKEEVKDTIEVIKENNIPNRNKNDWNLVDYLKKSKEDKKKKNKKIVLIIIGILFGCGFVKAGVDYLHEVKRIEFINSADIISVRDTIDLSYVIEPDNASYESITYEFDNPELIELDSNNDYIAIGEGTENVSIICDGEYFGSKEITIKPILVKEITCDDLVVEIGRATEVSPIVYPNNATHLDFEVESSDSEIVYVNENNELVGISEGSALITITSIDGASCTSDITVVPVEPTSISIKSKNTLIFGNDYSASIEFSPSDTTYKDVEWISSNSSVLYVDEENNIVVRSIGKATLTAKYSDEIYDSIDIEAVYPDPSSVEITSSYDSIYVGGTVQLRASISPKKVSDNSLSWSSSDENVATVNSNGVVSGKSEGTATITVYTINGVSDTFTVSVLKAVQKSNVSRSSGGSSGSYSGGSGAMVWIPTHGGKKYHSHAGCSNMIDPIQVTESEAIAQGFTACKRCY